jgi:hypothetical protein
LDCVAGIGNGRHQLMVIDPYIPSILAPAV